MPEDAADTYDLYAIRYARRDAKRAQHFIGGDPHDGPMPMDYFLWVAVGNGGGAEGGAARGRVFVIDTGFTAEVAARREREWLRCPVETLRELSIDPADVEDVILSHLHYDHVGNFDLFPKARFHLQEREIHYATGRFMQYPRLAHSFEVDHVCGIVRLNYARRVVFYDGDAQIAPGIRLHRVGGHSAGLQFVTVNTRRGRVVVASDATHFYENMETGRPYTTCFHIGEMLEGYDALRRAAASEDLIVPGHDPKVMERYPAVSPELENIIIRLDVPPTM